MEANLYIFFVHEQKLKQAVFPQVLDLLQPYFYGLLCWFYNQTLDFKNFLYDFLNYLKLHLR